MHEGFNFIPWGAVRHQQKHGGPLTEELVQDFLRIQEDRLRSALAEQGAREVREAMLVQQRSRRSSGRGQWLPINV